MAKVIFICGKICSGKSAYAARLRIAEQAAILSVDEIMLALFGQHTGDKHDEYTEKTKRYLFNKSLELIETGSNVILDWGFWQREERALARSFYAARGIPCSLHYIDIDPKTWAARLEKRNAAVQSGQTSAYFVDEGLAAKFDRLFQPPEPSEVDVWVRE